MNWLLLAVSAATVIDVNERPADLLGGADIAAYQENLGKWSRLFDAMAQGKLCDTQTVTAVTLTKLPDGYYRAEGIKTEGKLGAPYRERVRVEGCGIASVQNMVVAHGSKGWKVTPLAPGDSLASYRAQQEAMVRSSFYGMTLTELMACDGEAAVKSHRMTNTRVVSPPNAAGAWTEQWDYVICGKARSAPVTFTPSRGGRVTVSVPET